MTVEEAVWTGVLRFDRLADRAEAQRRTLIERARRGDDVCDEAIGTLADVERETRRHADALRELVRKESA